MIAVPSRLRHQDKKDLSVKQIILEKDSLHSARMDIFEFVPNVSNYMEWMQILITLFKWISLWTLHWMWRWPRQARFLRSRTANVSRLRPRWSLWMDCWEIDVLEWKSRDQSFFFIILSHFRVSKHHIQIRSLLITSTGSKRTCLTIRDVEIMQIKHLGPAPSGRIIRTVREKCCAYK